MYTAMMIDHDGHAAGELVNLTMQEVLNYHDEGLEILSHPGLGEESPYVIYFIDYVVDERTGKEYIVTSGCEGPELTELNDE